MARILAIWPEIAIISQKKVIFGQKMTDNDQLHQQVQKILQPGPKNVRAIHAELDGLSERSLRRKLSEWVKDRRIEKVGQGRNTRYAAVSSYSQKPLLERQPVSYNFACLNDYQPNQTFYLPRNIREECFEHGQRAKESAMAGTYARQIFQRLLIDLSYNSSRLEGNTYSLIETEKLLLEGIEAQNRLDAEKVMILNHKEAIKHLVDNARRIQLDAREVLTIHYLLSDALVPGEYSGSVRNQAVRIGGSVYLPLENESVLEKQLSLICEKAGLINDPFEQSIFLLAHIAYLQPFIDVNKRTSRLCANIPMIQQNLVPLPFNDVDKNEYMNAMIAMYEINDIGPLVKLYHQSYLRACQQYDATLIAMAIDEERVRYRSFRRECLSEIIKNTLVGDSLAHFIKAKLAQQVAQEDQMAVEEDLLEDLRLLSPPRIAGLGVSQSQLEVWQKQVEKQG